MKCLEVQLELSEGVIKSSSIKKDFSLPFGKELPIDYDGEEILPFGIVLFSGGSPPIYKKPFPLPLIIIEMIEVVLPREGHFPFKGDWGNGGREALSSPIEKILLISHKAMEMSVRNCLPHKLPLIEE